MHAARAIEHRPSQTTTLRIIEDPRERLLRKSLARGTRLTRPHTDITLASADGNLANSAREQHRLDALAEIALQHDRVAIDRAAAAERDLERAAPGLEL